MPKTKEATCVIERDKDNASYVIIGYASNGDKCISVPFKSKPKAQKIANGMHYALWNISVERVFIMEA